MMSLAAADCSTFLLPQLEMVSRQWYGGMLREKQVPKSKMSASPISAPLRTVSNLQFLTAIQSFCLLLVMHCTGSIIFSQIPSGTIRTSNNSSTGNNSNNVYRAIIVAKQRYGSSPGSFGECRTSPGDFDKKTKPTNSGHKSAYMLLLSAPTIAI